MVNCENTQNKGVAVGATPPKPIPTKSNFTYYSLHNQRLKLLDYLCEHGSITTCQVRGFADIYYLAARAFELKHEGYLITIIWNSWSNNYGIQHRIARYVLTQHQPLMSEV